jgi:hypothetical protein
MLSSFAPMATRREVVDATIRPAYTTS